MDNAISFLNSYSLDSDFSGGTTDQRGKTSLSVVSGLDKAVSPAVHLHSVASQLICLLKLWSKALEILEMPRTRKGSCRNNETYDQRF